MCNSNIPLIPAGMLLRLIHNKQQILFNYETLLTFAYDEQTSDIISGIIFDEKHHLSLFSSLYSELFGGEPELLDNLTSPITSYISGLPMAVLSEFDTYLVYSSILLTDNDQKVKDTFKRATIDENIHSSKYIFLQNKLFSELLK